jgi:GMP synthase (glutamine-hydrolysing)
MSHFDKLVHLPDGFKTIATTKNSEFAGIAHDSLPVFGMCVLSKLALNFAHKYD